MTTRLSAAPSAGVFSLALPIILANLSSPLVGFVDTAIVGHLNSAHYLAGLGIVTTVFSTMYWMVGFVRMGTTSFAAQSVGARDMEALGASFTRGWLLAVAIALAMILLQGPLGALAFTLLEGSQEAVTAAEKYFYIRIWSAPAALTNMVVMGWLIGIRRTRDALGVQLVLNGLNAGLDVLFVQGFGWGIDGVAAGTAISEYVAAGLGLWVIRYRMAGHGTRMTLTGLFERSGLSRLFSVNRDIFIRTFFLMVAFALITREGGRLGDLYLASNAILWNMLGFLTYGLDGFAQAAEALVGSAYGSRDRTALRAAFRQSTVWAAGTAAAYSVFFAVLGPVIVDLYTDLPNVLSTTNDYLFWLIVSPLLSVWCFQLDGVFIGAQRTQDMRNMMFVAFLAFIAALYLLVPVWGNHGVWGALMIFYVVRGVTLAACYPALERSASKDVASTAPAAGQ